MYRDPSEFRERFQAYKNGKSVREIYGLPGYAKGTVGADPELDMIKKYEGWRDKTYLDSKNIPTIGWGFTDTSLVSKGRMSRKEGDAYLSKRVEKRKAYLRNKLGPQIWDKLDTATRAALLSYDHNYPAGFGDDTRFMKHWRAGRYNDAVREMDAGMNDESSPGLRTRRLDEQATVRKDPFLFPKVKPQKPEDALIQRADVTRTATIPTAQQQIISHVDRRNTVGAEIDRTIWANKVMNDIQGMAYDIPIWESPSLPALTPVEYDVTPFKYANGKLPGYQWGKAKEIQQGRKQIPIDKAEAATEPDYNDGWFLTTIKRGVNSAIKTAKDQVRAIRNIWNGRGTLGDYVEVGIDALTGAAGKLLGGSAKEAKQVARRTLKPTKASTKKFDTRDPNKVGAYYSAHPEEVTPLTNNPEVKEVVNFMNNHIGPKYAKQNGIHVGIDPNDIKLGYADLSGSNLGGYVGPSGEVVLNRDILNNRDQLRYVLGHEIAGHWFDQHYPLTVPQMSTVGYGMPFKQDFLAERPWFNAIKEANAERRAFQLMTYFDKGVLGEDLDEAIKHMPMAEAKRYIDRLGYTRGINWQWPDLLPFKQAVTSVPTVGIPLYAGIQTDEYKNGKLPGYKDGHNTSHAKMNSDGTFTDDYTKVFEDMYVTPQKVDLKYGSHTLNNFPEYLTNRSAWMQSFMPASVLNEKPLERVYPEFDLIMGLRGLYTDPKTTTPKYNRSKQYSKVDELLEKERRLIENYQNKVNAMSKEQIDKRTAELKDNFNNSSKIAKDYANDNRRQALYNKVLDDAERLGYIHDRYGIEDLAYIDETAPVKVKMMGPLYRGDFDPWSGVVNLDLINASPTTPIHEAYHSVFAGNPVSTTMKKLNRLESYLYTDEVYNNPAKAKTKAFLEAAMERAAKNRIDLGNYYSHIVGQNLKENSSNYISDASEFVVHGLEEGKRLGIVPFQENPGIDKIKQLWSVVDKDSRFNKNFNISSPNGYENYWKALTGTLLPISISVPMLTTTNLNEYKDGKISIKPSKRGTFTAAAKKHGASVREFESRVLKNPEKYSTAMVKKARFSRNARSWKH